MHAIRFIKVQLTKVTPADAPLTSRWASTEMFFIGGSGGGLVINLGFQGGHLFEAGHLLKAQIFTRT